MKVAITGTRYGMTDKQREAFRGVLALLCPTWFVLTKIQRHEVRPAATEVTT